MPEELENALTLLRDLHSRVPNLKFEQVDTGVDVFLDEVRAIVSVSAHLLELLKPFRIPGSTNNTQIRELFSSFIKARAVRDSLDNDGSIKAILGDHYRGVRTSKQLGLREPSLLFGVSPHQIYRTRFKTGC